MKLEEMDRLQKELFINVRAAQPAMIVRTSEPHDAMESMLAVVEDKGWHLWLWDAQNGLTTSDEKPGDKKKHPQQQQPQGLTGVPTKPTPAATLLAAMDTLRDADNCLRDNEGKIVYQKGIVDDEGKPVAQRVPVVLFLLNGHRFLEANRQADMLVQALQHQAEYGKGHLKHVVIVSPRGVSLPAELDPLYALVDHARPNEAELAKSLDYVAPDSGDIGLTDDERKRVIEAGMGMTRFQYEGAIGRCLVENKAVLTADYIWQHKVELINRSPALTLYRGKETFDDLGGMQGMKDFAIRSLTSQCKVKAARARGIVIGGPPGTGKTAFCKALGNMIGRPTLIFDVGSLKGSLHGQTEQNLREVIDICNSSGRIILFLDEVEKALAGAGHDAQTSGGIMTGVLGTMLSWMSDTTAEIYFIMSTNDIAKLPAPFIRAGRIDAVFHLDLPGADQKQKIWQIYLKKFELPEQDLPDDENWTGAEIESCCASACRLGIPLTEAYKYVVPVWKRIREEITATRLVAKTTCLDAETGMVFAEGGQGGATGSLPGRPRGKVKRNIQAEKV